MQIFNEIYINCKYQALMNMMLLFNKDKNLFLYGFIPKYEFEENYKVYQVKNQMYKPIADLLIENGIYEEKILFSDNILEIIDKCRDNKEKCLIIRIDLYYTPHNLNYYKKKHYKRFILIHNVNKKNATILDKDQYNNYKEYYQIPLGKIEKWYNGYLNNYYFTGIRNDESIFIYNMEKTNINEYNPKELISKVILQLKDVLDSNLNILEQILNKIKNNEEFEIMKTFEKLLASKKVEEYRYSILEDNIINEHIKRQQQIINEIRLELLRNSNQKKTKVINKFSESIKLEKEIIDKLLYIANKSI